MTKKLRLAINGFGRIGRVVTRAWWQNYRELIDLVAVNTSGSIDIDGWAHLLKYDSVYGRFPAQINASKEGIVIGGQEIPFLAQRDPTQIPWKKYSVDLVLEATGVFRDRSAEGHFKGGVSKVILTAPPKDTSIPTFVIGVNQDQYRNQNLLSNGSCTTNCVAPIVKLIDEQIGFSECWMTTIHASTSDQNLLDNSHQDLRRARTAALNIIPTSTGAAKAVEAVYPEIKGRFGASAIRVPVSIGSFAELIFKTKKKVDSKQINKIFETVASGKMVGIIKVSYEPLVSTDVIGNDASALIDLSLTEVLSDDMVKVAAWYDNEHAFSCRLLELASFVSDK
ncbi:MAG: type I glyceraldehyde-3-phosphate dehydrogenase [Patescibacteria group bacterium]